MKQTQIKTKDEAIQKAIDWQNWQAYQNLRWREVNDWQDYFNELAEKFNLTEEYKENGII